MAASGNPTVHQAELRGYPKEILIAEVHEQYLCPKCQLVLRDPVQVVCGHIFCAICSTSMGNDVVCPACKLDDTPDLEVGYMKTDQMYPDMAMRREMGKLASKCINPGCSWTGPFKLYKEHELKCEHKGITCPACNKDIAESELQEHMLTSCPKRKIKCSLCNMEVTFSEYKDHGSKVCPKVVISCDACHKKCMREQYQKHLEDECTKRIVACPAGCSEVLHYDQLQTHIQKNVSVHIKYTLEATQQLSKRIEERVNSLTAPNVAADLAQSIDALTARIAALENGGASSAAGASGGSAAWDDIGLASRFASTELRLNAFEPIMGVLHHEIEKCIGIIEVMEKKQAEDNLAKEAYWKKVEDVEKLVKTLERNIGIKDISLAQYELRLDALEFTRHDGRMTWKISGFKQKRRDALTGKTSSLYSPTFYTGLMGYKMCARLYPNGDGMGKGSHISLFFVLMRGHYDNLLQWPFKEKVTLMMIDQNLKEHVVDTFRPDPVSSSFRKPETEMNIASGCPLFLPLSRLEDPQYAYIKDDAMFITIFVDQSSASTFDLNPFKANTKYVSPPT